MNNIIELTNINKSFDGNAVLNDFNFSLAPGSVLGILGANGAGKSTLISIILGFLNADSGECRVYNDTSPNLSVASKQHIGYVPQQNELIPWMKVKHLIEYTASFYKTWQPALCEHLVSLWKIDTKQRVEALSVGQRQKLAILLELSHSPELLILDEPVASLDPLARRSFIKELIELNMDLDKSIVFSTHITSDLERVAADLLIIKNGRNIYQGEIDTLKERFIQVKLYAKTSLPGVIECPGIIKQAVSGNNATLLLDMQQFDGLEKLKQDFDAEIENVPMNLEDIFVELH